jgi:phosphotransferase system HPr (HPr) family protein
MGYRGATLRVAAGGREVDAKSLLSVLSLGAKAGTSLTLSSSGEDAEAALTALVDCIAGLTE